MESPQVTTDTAASPQPERQWVWRASLESRAAGKVSVLACVETVLAVVLYWWIAIRWDTHWHLVTSVFVAPLLLLRSPESIAAGVRWFMRDWFGFESYKTWPKAKQRASIASVSTISVVTAFYFARWFSGIVMMEAKSGWGLFCCSVLIVSVTGLVAAANLFAVALGRGATDTLMIVALKAACFASLLGALVAAFVVGAQSGVAETIFGLIAVVVIICVGVLTVSPSAGFSLRALFSRICATVRFIPHGLCHLPSNWRENNLITDVCIPAELLPNIRRESVTFALDGFIVICWNRNAFIRPLMLLLIPILFLPAFLYRLNIKATAWFWWPLAFLLRPVKQPTVEGDQKEALCWPWTNPFQKLLFVGISLLAMAVLFARHVDPVRWSRLSKVEGVWTPVKALLALDWSHFPPWHWAIFVSAVCGLGMLALAGGAVSCAANKKWPPPGLGWKVKAMEALVRVRSLATVALLLFSLGALFIAHTPWHAHVPLPKSWYSAMKKFYRVSEPEAKR